MEVRLWEVSVCTFPAYEETEVSARKRDAEEAMKEIREKKTKVWREETMKKLKGEI